MNSLQVLRIGYAAVMAVFLGLSPLPSYALADNIISQVVGGLLFVVACAVAVVACLGALLTLAAGSTATSKKCAVVAGLAVGGALLLKPAPSYVFEYSEEAIAKVAHPFGLVMQPDTTDAPTPLPPLRDYDLAADSTHFDKLYTYVSPMPQLAGGRTAAIRFVQKYLRYPDAARQHETTGLVVVRFVVDEAGEVHNTKITRSLGYGCDEEALRLVRGLPTFQNNANAPVQLTWMFSFRPPELPVQ
ncbi:MAG: energy transducer TonB [Janthinobacterium lividum]